MMRRLCPPAALLAWAVVFPSLALAAAGLGESALRHEMDIHLNPTTGEVSVRDRLRIGGASSVAFHLGEGFAVTRLTVDGKDAAAVRRGGTLAVDLGSMGTHDVVFDYRGRLAHVAPGARQPFTSLADRQGSYLPGAARWYPRLDDRPFAYRLTVEVPAPQVAVAPGRLVEERRGEKLYRATFRSEAPTDAMVLMAGPYSVAEREHGGILLRAYFHPEIAFLAEGYLESVAGYLDLFQAEIGAYPFSAFSVVSSPLPVGLGFPGLAYIGTRVLRLPFIRESSLGHEVLHNWWGNGVRVDDRSGNWAEGLTTYMADYAFAERASAKKALAMRLRWLRDYAALPPERDRAAGDFVAKRHDAAQVIGYGKVAMVFHMLRNDVGASAFNDAIRRFWRRYRFRTAAWSDLRGVFEEASGRDLRKFFAQWLDRPGAPRLKLGPVRVTALEGAYRVSFTLSQARPDYALRVPVAIKTAAGYERFAVNLDAQAARYTLAVRGRPLELAVDPDFDLFRRLAPSEAPPILREVTLNPRTETLILAPDERTRRTAERLARALLDSVPRLRDPRVRPPPSGPLLVIGLTGEVAAFLAESGLAGVPKALAGRGTARAWAARYGEGFPLVVVAADSARALEALVRPLPHYGAKGFLVFEDARAVNHGVWPAGAGPLRVRLGESENAH